MQTQLQYLEEQLKKQDDSMMQIIKIEQPRRLDEIIAGYKRCLYIAQLIETAATQTGNDAALERVYEYTESQDTFVLNCILDSYKLPEDLEESIWEKI